MISPSIENMSEVSCDHIGIPEPLMARIISLIAADGSLRRAILFGSRARGDYMRTSDIDIVIESDNPSPHGSTV